MPPETKTTAQAVQAYYEDNLRDMVDNRPAPVREQVAAAMKAVPASADQLDKWFGEHLKKAPLSHDTVLYNRLHQAKEDLKAVLSAKPAAPGT